MFRKRNMVIVFLILLVCVLPCYRQSMDIITGFTPAMTIVIDPGHGGQDSGAVARDGTGEKDINLAISKLLKEEASRYRVSVVLTRQDDQGLYENEESEAMGQWSKLGDMKARKDIMEKARPDLVVSIHLNSFFADEGVHGAQVFYPTNCNPSVASKNETLAKTVRETLMTELSSDEDRIILPKKDMFIFRDAEYEGLLVECGFLSNADDLSNLKNGEYQKAFAAALMKGIAVNYGLTPET